ncbi:hypothetical protein RchiOBHm_Chr1g0333031 [Rosa chinensis]|uniref:Uncharacterized protein n=1 Tax=Rosa chinensis TaxID=74649 RepID=A0A2P6SBZ0_ROSCH|nr:hypothetical protein RchiOBHm_Chr1g0333031 [Rosa chinensis]
MFSMVQKSTKLLIMYLRHFVTTGGILLQGSYHLIKELGPLLRDYQHQITRRHLENGGSDPELVESGSLGKVAYGFYHIRNVNQGADDFQLRIDDIPKLLVEYKQLLN